MPNKKDFIREVKDILNFQGYHSGSNLKDRSRDAWKKKDFIFYRNDNIAYSSFYHVKV